MVDASGPGPDRAAAELAEAEQIARAYAEERRSYTGITSDDVRLVLAELDRQRVIVRAAEALVECDAAKPGLGQSISVWRHQRRELLDALAAAVRALLEGKGR